MQRARGAILAFLVSFSFFLVVAVPLSLAKRAEHASAVHGEWEAGWLFGARDHVQLRRGFRVYWEVCSACHSMSFLTFRDLGRSDGPAFRSESIAAFAASVLMEDGPDAMGKNFVRPGRVNDSFPKPFSKEWVAREANNGFYPVDLSSIAKTRAGGAESLYALLTGYGASPPHAEEVKGAYYNSHFLGSWIGMAPPLYDGIVVYSDGAPETVDQYARDVAAFLAWAAEPHRDERHRMGLGVMLFMVILIGLLLMSKRRLWKEETRCGTERSGETASFFDRREG